MAFDLNRLKAQLLISGLQQKDPVLYQVINSLIQQLEGVIVTIGNLVIPSSLTTNVFLGSGVGLPGADGDDGEDGVAIIGPQGLPGVAGATGATGPTTIGPMGIDGEDGSDGYPLPGPQGIQGATGSTGATGPPTIGPMGIDGEDGEDGYPIPGPQGLSAGNDSWEGRIVGTWGDGNPIQLLRNYLAAAVASPTPTNIGTSVARCCYFKLRSSIVVNTIRWWGIGVTTAVYHIAIYRASDDVRISSDNNPNTTLNAWNSIADTFTLDAGVLYYCAVSVDTGGATAGIGSFTDTSAATAGLISVAPTAYPGNLASGADIITPFYLAQAAVTLGVLPNPGNTPTAPAAWTGGMPAIWLDNA